MADIQQAAKDTVDAVREQKIPKQIRDTAREGVAKSREAYDQVTSVAKDNFKDVERLIAASYDGAKELSGKMLQHYASNADAVFDAAQAMAGARTLPEASKIYMDAVQRQMTAMGEQMQELQETSMDAMTRAMNCMQTGAKRVTNGPR